GGLAPAVAAAIAEVGAPEACLVMIENPSAEIAPLSLDRIVARFGHLGAIREALLARDDLPAPTRQALVAKLSETLAGFVTAREWLGAGRAERVAREACEKATVTLAAISPRTEVAPLIEHLRESGQLNAGLILRALLSGNVALFEHALADLSGLPLARVSALVHDRRSSALRALYERAGLPASTYAAFHEAMEAMKEVAFLAAPDGPARLRRAGAGGPHGRRRAAAHAAAPLCGRGCARGGAGVLPGAGRGRWRCRGRRRAELRGARRGVGRLWRGDWAAWQRSLVALKSGTKC